MASGLLRVPGYSWLIDGTAWSPTDADAVVTWRVRRGVLEEARWPESFSRLAYYCGKGVSAVSTLRYVRHTVSDAARQVMVEIECSHTASDRPGGNRTRRRWLVFHRTSSYPVNVVGMGLPTHGRGSVQIRREL